MVLRITIFHEKIWINHERGQMPIDVAVEEPRARVVRVVSEEADRDIITRIAHAHDVADNEVIKLYDELPALRTTENAWPCK